jgi:hypothetical protein
MTTSAFRSIARGTIFALTATAALVSARDASAQGCVLFRESAPVIGAASSTYLQPGEWQLDISFRDSTADKHYVLDQYQAQRTDLGTNVINTQKQTLFNISRGLTPRFSVSAVVPIVFATWGIPAPRTPVPGPRATEHGQGLGDVSVMGRFWLLNPQTHSGRNLSIGLGVKAPTGPSNQYDTYVDSNGLNPTSKPIDSSIEPGDSGWGVQVEFQGYTRIGPVFAFGSFNYLLNPRDVSDAVYARAAGLYQRDHNSVPDQFLGRVGVGVPIWKYIGASVAFRAEGVPRYDLIGRSDGFRRPGHEFYVEPGITITAGRNTFQFNVPLGVYRYRSPDPYTGNTGDATFPDAVAIASYSLRFGGGKHHDMPSLPTPPVQRPPAVQPGTRQDVQPGARQDIQQDGQPSTRDERNAGDGNQQ